MLKRVLLNVVVTVALLGAVLPLRVSADELAEYGGVDPVAVANRCANEAGWEGGVHLCACTVQARLGAGWMPNRVLEPYLASDGVATAGMIEQAKRGLKGEGCPDDPYYLFSAACVAVTGVDMSCATGFSKGNGKIIYTFPKDALNSCVQNR